MRLYKINYHSTDDILTHCTVIPITVIRNDIMPGCSLPSITAIDENGRKFIGSIENYFNSEEEAWFSIKEEIKGAITLNKAEVETLTKRIKSLEHYLETLK